MADINLLPEEYKKKSEENDKKKTEKPEIQYTTPLAGNPPPVDKKQNWRQFLDSVLPKKKDKKPDGIHPLKTYPPRKTREKPIALMKTAIKKTPPPTNTDGVMSAPVVVKRESAPSLWSRMTAKRPENFSNTTPFSMSAKSVFPQAAPKPVSVVPPVSGKFSVPPPPPLRPLTPPRPLPVGIPPRRLPPKPTLSPMPPTGVMEKPMPLPRKPLETKKIEEREQAKGRDFLRFRKKPFGLDVNLVPTDILMTAKPKSLMTTFAWLNVGAVAFVLLGYVGLMLYGLRLQNSTTDLNNQIQKVNTQIATYGPLQKEAKTLKTKIDATKALLGEHIYWTKVLTKVQESAISSVTFQSISADTKGNFQITARAENFSAIADQTRVFQNADFVEKVNVSGGARQTDDETEKQPIQFTITMKIKAETFFHSDSL